METKNEINSKNIHKNKVHKVLAHSYLVYFALFLAGVCLDLIFKFKIFINYALVSVGAIILLLGFGIIVNAPFVILSAIISFIVTKFVFLSKEEKILADKYGTPYLEYK